jgi:hypothetical protein
MIGRLRELTKEPLDGPALLRPICGDDTIAFRALDLDRPERRGGALEPELPAARRPQVPYPLRLAPARHEIADASVLERAPEGHGPRLARLPTRHDQAAVMITKADPVPSPGGSCYLHAIALAEKVRVETAGGILD